MENQLNKNKINLEDRRDALGVADLEKEFRATAEPLEAYHVYALTLSSNKAIDKTAYRAYDHVISNLPSGTFTWIREQSNRGKYHVHGLLRLKCKFNYSNLQASKVTDPIGSNFTPYEYDIHLHFDEIKTSLQLKWWAKYCFSENPKKIYTITTDETQIRRIKRLRKSCIQVVQKRTYSRGVTIPGYWTH